MKKKSIFTAIALGITLLGLAGCSMDDYDQDNTDSNTKNGVTAKRAEVKTQSDGMTAEQQNVKKRLELENKPGAIQYFYAFSPMDNTYFYATVKGKVTSSNKSLHPSQVAAIDGEYIGSEFSGYNFNNKRTGQVIGEDGTYGDSAPYLYFFDEAGNYYQYYINSSFQIVVSTKPIAIPSSKVRVDLVPAK